MTQPVSRVEPDPPDLSSTVDGFGRGWCVTDPTPLIGVHARDTAA